MTADLLALLRERLGREAVARRKRRRLVRTRRPVPDGGFSELHRLDAISVETLLERRATVLFELEDGNLIFERKRVHVPSRAREELEAIVAAEEPFRAADLPGGLDDESRLVLVRRLIREGFLRRSAADG
jgi:hypothetical protein